MSAPSASTSPASWNASRESSPEPGGLSTRQVVDAIQRLRGEIVGGDVVEFNPLLDPTGITAMVAAKIVKEMAARIVGS